MIIVPQTVIEWMIFYAVAYVIAITGLMVLLMGMLALAFSWRLVIDIYRHGL